MEKSKREHYKLEELIGQGLAGMTLDDIEQYFGSEVVEIEQARRTAMYKARLLQGYSDNEPHMFRLYDGFCKNTGDADYKRDEDGDALMWKAEEWELVTGNLNVSILIEPSTKKKDALRLLKKLVKLIKKEYGPVTDPPPDFVEENDIPF